jgi:tight adherence protein C
MLLVLAVAVGCAVASATLLAVRVVTPRRQLRIALARAGAYGAAPAAAGDAVERRPSALFEPVARIAVKLVPSATQETLARKLAAAGLLRTISARTFAALKAGAACAGAVAGLAVGAAAGGGVRPLLAAIGLGAAGFLTPDVLLNARVRRRREQILAGLPNALDLLAVSVEAGLGLDAAVARLVDATDGPIAEELGLVLAELRVGVGRHDALRRFADRVRAPEAAAFVRAVIHADQLGTSLTSTLRTQAQETRLRRHAAAEEQAGKAPVRMLFPTVLFIFPALFVVVLGPAVLALIRAF